MHQHIVPADDIAKSDAGGGKANQQAKRQEAQKCENLGGRRGPVFFTITYEEDTLLLS